MKTIIAGSRTATFKDVMKAMKICPFVSEITHVVSGTARGADKAGEDWASLVDIPIIRFPAKWDEFGRGAGHMRNKEMAQYADALVAVWDGQSKGTANMIVEANKLNLELFIYRTDV